MNYHVVIFNADGEIIRAEKVTAELAFDESGAASNDIYTKAAEILEATDGGARSVVVPLSLVTLSVTCALSAAKTANGRGGKAATLPHESANAERTAEREKAERNAARRMHSQTRAARDTSAQKIIFSDLQYLAADALRNAANANAAEAARVTFAEFSPISFKYNQLADAAEKARKDARSAERRAEYYAARSAERKARGEVAKAEADAARAVVWKAKAEARADAANASAADAAAWKRAHSWELSAFSRAAELATLPPFDYDNWLYTRGRATAAEKLAAERLAEYAESVKADAEAAAWTAESAAEYARAKAAAELAAERAERSPFERLRHDTADYLAECVKTAEAAAARVAAERLAERLAENGGSGAEAARKYAAARDIMRRAADAEKRVKSAQTLAERRKAAAELARLEKQLKAAEAYAAAFEKRAAELFAERGAEYSAAEHVAIRAEVYAAANAYVKTWKRIRGAEVYTEYLTTADGGSIDALCSWESARAAIMDGNAWTAENAEAVTEAARRRLAESGAEADAERLAELAEAAAAEAERSRRLAAELAAINAAVNGAAEFSGTEKRVFSLMLSGESIKAISRKTRRSENTISRHICALRAFAARHIAENAAEFSGEINAAEAAAAERVITLNADAAARMRKYRERKRAEKAEAERRTLAASMINAARDNAREAEAEAARRRKVKNAQTAERMRKYRARKAAAAENVVAAELAAEIERRTLAENAARMEAEAAARRIVTAKAAAATRTADGARIAPLESEYVR